VTGTAWKKLIAYAIIYLVWGSTYLAIRIGVAEVPPFLYAAMRFGSAGALLCAWVVARGERLPGRREWPSILLLAFLIFVMDYGLLFWAEQRVPSGLAAVMLGTIPMFMTISEIVILKTRRPSAALAVALLAGLAGVAVLTAPAGGLGGEPIDRAGALALIVAALSWSIATALSRKLPLPSSELMSSGTQMLVGGAMLALAAAALGELGRFEPGAVSRSAWLALAYLAIPGSIVAYTAYVWLIKHDSPTRVGTYAYVNPVVAVLLGWLAGGEPLGLRTVLGTALVLVGVVVILVTKGRSRH
jgi:drug/metabolite transporter (DMT)-like permease